MLQERYRQRKREGYYVRSLTRRQLLQSREIAIKSICIATIGVRIRILPDSLIWPSARDRPNGAVVACQDKWTGGMERCTLTRALTPPIIGTVDHGIASRLELVCRDERLDPRDHCGFTQAVAGGTIWIILNVKHPWERDTIVGPASAVGKEEGRLSAAGTFVRVCKVVSSSDEAGTCGSGIMTGEVRVDVRCALGSLRFVSDVN